MIYNQNYFKMAEVQSRADCLKDFHHLGDLLESYIDELDVWQRTVDNIRIMHHEVWRDSRLSPLIRQHRAGSRVEKHVRLLTPMIQTDVDYMFEVIGLEVQCGSHCDDIYFKCNNTQSQSMGRHGMSNTYGRIYAKEHYKHYLENHEHFKYVFKKTLYFDEEEGAYLVSPAKFKENVIANCGLDYTRNESSSSSFGPSAQGHGVLNEYDGVPCLKLSEWPQEILKWTVRQNDDVLFNQNWKSEIVQDTPLFLVPTGDRTSQNRKKEFRLSFSMVEIACFEKLTPQMRKAWSIVKYVYKVLFIKYKVDLLSTYHVKTMMMWTIDQVPIQKWQTMSITAFMPQLMVSIRSAVHAQNIPHFFVENCNIYPVHKHTSDNILRFNAVFDNLSRHMLEEVVALLQQDLQVQSRWQWLDNASLHLHHVHKTGPNNYISGYLTRLLSVITFSITENYRKSNQMGDESIGEILCQI